MSQVALAAGSRFSASQLGPLLGPKTLRSHRTSENTFQFCRSANQAKRMLLSKSECPFLDRKILDCAKGKAQARKMDTFANHRDESGRFTSGNPGGPGRPAGPTLRPLLRELLSEQDANGESLERRMLSELLRLATDSGERTQHRLRAIELVMQAAEWRSINTPAGEIAHQPITLLRFEE